MAHNIGTMPVDELTDTMTIRNVNIAGVEGTMWKF